MTKRTQIGISVLIIAAFIIARQGFLLKAAGSLFASEWTHSLRVVAFYAEWLLFIILASLILNRFRFAPILHDLGLTVFFKRGLLVAFLATLPMLIGYVFIGHLNENLSVAEIMQGALLPGFMEELLFRGFLFGLLFRRAGWGFLPAAAVSAILFAAGHLYQSSDLGVSAGIFFTTLLGGGWFAWLYIEWDDCLWVPIGLHVFMNLWWVAFDMGENALGGGPANIFRIITIVITIVVTIRHRKRLGRFIVAGKTLYTNGG